jgi:hypothetical protein
MDLEEHENPDVQALVAARLGSKSTQEESRTKRLIGISQCDWPGKGQALIMPFPLRYSGAHTHRLSGDWKINTQNFTRGGKLRKALKAPPGHKVLVADASQIEARLNACFCGCTALVSSFAAGDDVYSKFAAKVFNKPINKKDHPTERFVGKQAVLGLGYNLGWATFQKRLTTDSLNQTGNAIRLDDFEAQNVVRIYRTDFHEIPAMWKWLQAMIPQMTRKDCYVEYGPIIFLHEKIKLPNGLYLYYHDLHCVKGDWVFTYNGKKKYLYGGKLLENIIQALSRIITMDAAARCQRRFRPYGVHLALQAHDELGYIVPDEHVDICRSILMEEMRVRPDWLPGVPLDAESGVGLTYGSAK